MRHPQKLHNVYESEQRLRRRFIMVLCCSAKCSGSTSTQEPYVSNLPCVYGPPNKHNHPLIHCTGWVQEQTPDRSRLRFLVHWEHKIYIDINIFDIFHGQKSFEAVTMTIVLFQHLFCCQSTESSSETPYTQKPLSCKENDIFAFWFCWTAVTNHRFIKRGMIFYQKQPLCCSINIKGWAHVRQMCGCAKCVNRHQYHVPQCTCMMDEMKTALNFQCYEQ